MKIFIKRPMLVILLGVMSIALQAQVLDKSWRSIIEKMDDDWYATKEAKEIAENVLLYQRDIGGWQKNIQMQKPLSEEERQNILAVKKDSHDVTIDNGATYQEMLFLSKMYSKVPDERYKKAFLLGLDYILKAQYDNGGWPQFYPLRKGYYSHITFNDDAMVNILKILKELKENTNYFSIKPSQEILERIKFAFDKGIDCILKTQYKQHGVLTSWCAQYDEITLLPAKARAYELPSLSGKESAQIVLLLMSIDHPSSEVMNAINSAVKWFEKVKITGLRQDIILNENGRIKDKKLVLDADAPPLWARFMELENNRPFFCDRDGIKKYDLSEIGAERRNGYAWYTNEPKEVFKKYERWSKTYNLKKNTEPQTITPKDPNKVIVSQDGTGDYVSIQDAINAAKSFPYDRVIIHIKNGIYYEKIKVHEWNTNISLIGESKENTIITYDDYFDKMNMGRNSTFYTYTLLVEADDFYASNLTIQNTAGNVGQAVALSVFSDKVFISNCNIIGNQDTLYASGKGRQYFRDCYIEGTTDFIFGSATAFFENCQIHSKKNSYITAASTPEGVEFGYVFKNCELTADKDVSKVYLGRPWRIYAKTVFINCNMGRHVLSEGWHNWSKPEAEKTTFYAEFQNNGEGFQPQNRAVWSHQLDTSEAENYTLKQILGNKKDNSKQEWYESFD